MAITFAIPVKQVPTIIKVSKVWSASPITKSTVARTHEINPIDIINRIPLKTNAFFVNKEHINADKYNAEMHDR